MPIGTLIRNAARQEISTRIPPTTGPSAAAIPDVAAQMRTAPARRSGGTDVTSSARLAGVSAAAPTACSTRAAMRTPSVGAHAARALAAVNTTTPPMKPRRLPSLSLAAPSGMRSAA
ncbi:Uncharacterised protein [Mycobacteroides abscessus subsp. abscessus]|nr:Uncharacterised protein [Mycobacteroides abscessus subsp. abscessus]